jgi:hypothetical protein
MTCQRIQQETQTLIQVSDKRVLTVEGASVENVQKALRQIEAEIGVPLDPLPVPVVSVENNFGEYLRGLEVVAPLPSSEDVQTFGLGKIVTAVDEYLQPKVTGEHAEILSEMQLTLKQYEELTRVTGNEFEMMFGFGQSLLDQIASQSSVKFELDPAHSRIVVIGNSHISVEAAERRIEAILGERTQPGSNISS